MNSEDFSGESTGRLVDIELPRSKVAFLPDPLPRNWEQPLELWPLITEARESIARLDGIGRYMPNPQLLLRPLQNREALRSSSMEGTYATPEELLLFEAEPVNPTSDKDRANEWLEVFNYGRALISGRAGLDEGYPLSLQLIRSMHSELLSGVRGQDKSPGQFRNVPVQIGHDARFVPPPPYNVEECLHDAEAFLEEELSIDCLIKAFMLHYQFETIHPFKDGNGRVGRLLLSLQIYRDLNLSNPWVYMSAFFERYKDEYINYLYNVSAKGDWFTWLAFCLRGVVEQARDTERRISSLLEIKDRYIGLINSQSQASARLVQIVNDLFENPVISVPRLKDKHNVSYPTAKADVDRLISLNILMESRMDIRPKHYLASEIMSAAYGEE